MMLICVQIEGIGTRERRSEVINNSHNIILKLNQMKLSK